MDAGSGNAIAAGRAGGARGALPAASLANAGAPPYSTAAVRGTTSQEWSTPQRMEGPAEGGVRHYM
jgi:hypothetical protein